MRDPQSVLDVLIARAVLGVAVGAPIEAMQAALGAPDAPPGRIARGVRAYTWGQLTALVERSHIIEIGVDFERAWPTPHVVQVQSTGFDHAAWCRWAASVRAQVKTILDATILQTPAWRIGIDAEGQLHRLTLDA